MIDQRLENWARYYRERMKYECCSSLEGNYRAPWRQWVELADIQHSVHIDWRDAELVEAAWRAIIGRSKLILKYTYMAKMPDYVICRKSHIKRWEYPTELKRAKNIIQQVLDYQKSLCYPCENLIRASERISPIEAEFSRPEETEPA